MSEYCDDFKAQIIKHIIGAYSGFVTRNCTCVEEHDHDLTKNPWEIEIKFDNDHPKWIRIRIEIEDVVEE